MNDVIGCSVRITCVHIHTHLHTYQVMREIDDNTRFVNCNTPLVSTTLKMGFF